MYLAIRQPRTRNRSVPRFAAKDASNGRQRRRDMPEGLEGRRKHAGRQILRVIVSQHSPCGRRNTADLKVPVDGKDEIGGFSKYSRHPRLAVREVPPRLEAFDRSIFHGSLTYTSVEPVAGCRRIFTSNQSTYSLRQPQRACPLCDTQPAPIFAVRSKMRLVRPAGKQRWLRGVVSQDVKSRSPPPDGLSIPAGHGLSKPPACVCWGQRSRGRWGSWAEPSSGDGTKMPRHGGRPAT